MFHVSYCLFILAATNYSFFSSAVCLAPSVLLLNSSLSSHRPLVINCTGTRGWPLLVLLPSKLFYTRQRLLGTLHACGSDNICLWLWKTSKEPYVRVTHKSHSFIYHIRRVSFLLVLDYQKFYYQTRVQKNILRPGCLDY